MYKYLSLVRLQRDLSVFTAIFMVLTLLALFIYLMTAEDVHSSNLMPYYSNLELNCR